MGKWFSRLTNDIVNVSSTITASLVCSLLIYKTVNSDIITKSTAWSSSDGNIICAPADMSCTVNCDDIKGSCGITNGDLRAGPQIHCPTDISCLECTINCAYEQACSASTIYGYDCDILNINVDQKDNKKLSIYTPNNGGSLFITVSNTEGKMKDSEIYAGTNSNNIIIDCSGSEFKTNTVNATHITGVLSFESSGSCKSDNSVFYCPANNCTIDCSGGDCKTMEITAALGTRTMDFTCDATCTGTKLICDYGIAQNTNSSCEITGCSGDCVDPPTFQPTSQPTSQPTIGSILSTTYLPTNNPTQFPSSNPTQQPSSNPSLLPTIVPSYDPTHYPTNNPMQSSTGQPTNYPSWMPSINPSYFPSNQPTNYPSSQPSFNPSNVPSIFPTLYPTSYHPTSYPTIIPTLYPTAVPIEMRSTENDEIEIVSVSTEERVGSATITILVVSISLFFFIFFSIILYFQQKNRKNRKEIKRLTALVISLQKLQKTPKGKIIDLGVDFKEENNSGYDMKMLRIQKSAEGEILNDIDVDMIIEMGVDMNMLMDDVEDVQQYSMEPIADVNTIKKNTLGEDDENISSTEDNSDDELDEDDDHDVINHIETLGKPTDDIIFGNDESSSETSSTSTIQSELIGNNAIY